MTLPARTATMLHPIGSPKAPVAMAPVTTVRGSMLMPTQMENSERTVPVRSVSGIGMMCRVSNWMRVWVVGISVDMFSPSLGADAEADVHGRVPGEGLGADGVRAMAPSWAPPAGLYSSRS